MRGRGLLPARAERAREGEERLAAGTSRACAVGAWTAADATGAAKKCFAFKRKKEKTGQDRGSNEGLPSSEHDTLA